MSAKPIFRDPQPFAQRPTWILVHLGRDAGRLRLATNAVVGKHDLEFFGLNADPQQFADYHLAVESNLASYLPIHDISMMPGLPLPDVPLESPALTQATSVSSDKSTYSRSTSSRNGHSPASGAVTCSPLARGPEPSRMGSLFGQMPDDDQDYWLQTLDKCYKLQFLIHGFGGRECLRPDQERLLPQMERFLRLEQHQTEKKDGLPSTPYSARSARNLLPPRSTCDILVDAYIHTFETVFRILHVPSFLLEYEHFWSQPLNFRASETNEPLLGKLVVILALGSTVIVNPSSIFAPSSLSTAEDLACHQKQSLLWISYGKKWLTRHMGTAQRTDINIAQVLCLLALVRHVYDDAERSMGILVHPGDFDLARIGMRMNFHRDPLILTPAMPMAEAETRRRLWATMVELSLQHSLDEGLPSSLLPESFDCKTPSDMTDEELGSDHVSAGSYRKLERLTSSTILVLLSRTQNMRLQCLHLVNSPGASKSYGGSHSLASELNSAHNANTNILRGMDTKPSEFQLQLLQTYTWQFVRALHEPFAEQATSNPSFHYSRKVRMEAAVRVLDWPPSLALATTAEHERPQVTTVDGCDDACMSLRIYGQGYLSRVQRQAAVSLCLDFIRELDDGMFRVSDGATWKRMHDVICDTILVYERCVKVSSATHGRKELVFLAAAEAYINAILTHMKRKEVEEAIYRAVDDAISLCCEVVDRGWRSNAQC
ncbi:hypothetical protein FSARC_8043 [Fusarium sarcochroum]|uniref:Xylanolytic transcriptional activator regulatory domain-containing protein n=1 Tax=Fusarium sarcochroum TaxID=1208366 RepID=A0A8H4X6S1_9HYPO|nr:hypothetical protein FSARC_8043 [Fusarium sarcochroum]